MHIHVIKIHFVRITRSANVLYYINQIFERMKGHSIGHHPENMVGAFDYGLHIYYMYILTNYIYILTGIY